MVFMAVVSTGCLLVLVFSQAERGATGLTEAVVYAFAAGFGLEFVGSTWTVGGRSGRLAATSELSFRPSRDRRALVDFVHGPKAHGHPPRLTADV